MRTTGKIVDTDQRPRQSHEQAQAVYAHARQYAEGECGWDADRAHGYAGWFMDYGQWDHSDHRPAIAEYIEFGDVRC
jgi:hypothetical protein